MWMGCFDFTYADNGRNIRGGRGYLYLTHALSDACKLPSVLPFTDTDEYGNLTCKWKGRTAVFDLYALLSLMLFLADPDLHASYAGYHGQQAAQVQQGCRNMIRMIRSGKVGSREMDACQDLVRMAAIDYFFDDRYQKEVSPDALFLVPSLGNQKSRTLHCKRGSSHPIPLLITRKQLHLEGDLPELARQWGFCSTDDPNQGWKVTRDWYCPYLPNQEKLGIL